MEIIENHQSVKEYKQLKEDSGLTSTGKIIPSSNSTAYDKKHNDPVVKMASHIQKTFPHYTRKDHEEAAKHHSSEASKSLSSSDFDGFGKSNEKAAAHRHVANKMFTKEIERDKKSHVKKLDKMKKDTEKNRKILAKFAPKIP